MRIKRRVILKTAAIAPVITHMLTACSARNEETTLGAYAPNAQQRLTVYTSHPEQVRIPFIREFEDRTGIWVETVYAGTQELLNRIAEEKGKGTGDVLFGGGVESLTGYDAYFMPYKSVELSAITRREFVSSKNYWTGFSALPLVFLYNTKLITQQNMPASWNELTEPKWKGKIAFCSPEVSGSCYTAISTAIQLYGEKWLDGFANNLDGNCLPSSNDIASGVATGTFLFGITVESNALQAIADGADLAYTYPSDGTSIVPDGVAILNGTQNIENAKKFVDFVLSSEAQTYLMEGLGRRPVRDGLPELISPPLSEIPVIDYDVTLAAESRIEWIARWHNLYSSSESTEAAAEESV